VPTIKPDNAGRPAYTVAALLLAAYAANVVVGKGDVSFGWNLPHASDTTEFVVVLTAMIAFVIGLLRNESPARHSER
jgi:hypothetical protein